MHKRSSTTQWPVSRIEGLDTEASCRTVIARVCNAAGQTLQEFGGNSPGSRPVDGQPTVVARRAGRSQQGLRAAHGHVAAVRPRPGSA